MRIRTAARAASLMTPRWPGAAEDEPASSRTDSAGRAIAISAISAPSQQLVGHDNQQWVRTGEDEPAPWQETLTLDQCLHTARRHHPGEGPAGKRNRQIVCAGRHDHRSSEQPPRPSAVPDPEHQQPLIDVAARPWQRDRHERGVVIQQRARTEHSPHIGLTEPVKIRLVGHSCEELLPPSRCGAAAGGDKLGRRLTEDLAARAGLLVDDSAPQTGSDRRQCGAEAGRSAANDNDVQNRVRPLRATLHGSARPSSRSCCRPPESCRPGLSRDRPPSRSTPGSTPCCTRVHAALP